MNMTHQDGESAGNLFHSRSRSERPWKRKYVYFIANGTAIKIGHSTSPSSRMYDLQGATSETLVMIDSFIGGPDDECALHTHFADLRLRGEWFQPDQRILDLIELLRRGRKLIERREHTVSDAITGVLDTGITHLESKLGKMAMKSDIVDVKRGLMAWAESQDTEVKAAAHRVGLSLNYCAMNGVDAIGQRELAKDVSALATAVGR